MTRRGFLGAATAAQQFSGAVTPPLAAQPGPPPNILWISCEDMSPDLGCYGDAYSHSPNLDRFASQGVRFDNAFSVAGVCAPSRSGIITGMYPSSIGTHHMRCEGVPPPYVRCFTEYLRAAGYYCTNNVKTDYNFASPLTGWDESSPRAHWRNRAKGQPFFSVFNITTTHESQIRAPEDAFAAHMKRVAPEHRRDPAKVAVPPYYPDTPAVRRDLANYYDLITSMDAQAGELLAQLEADGLAQNTAVFFWSDHGRGLPRCKRWIYESGTRVALMARWPGRIAAGSASDRLVSLIDLGPTMLSIAGIAAPEHMQAQAFLGPHAKAPRSHVYFIRDRMDEAVDMSRGVRDARYRYIRNYQAGKPWVQYIDYMEMMPTMREMRRLNKEGKLEGAQKLWFRHEKPVEELYDVARDPHEIDNLAGKPEYYARLIEMREVHQRWARETADLGRIPEEQLNERARPKGQWSVTAPPQVEPKGGKLAGSTKARITCATPGASIAYATESGPQARWKLYAGEIAVAPGTLLRARACRLGYRDSEETRAEYTA